ncbi:hypothetical protein FQA39_LY15577 [Lamprigera yunnana]|nr:hypothetical protein FQA39_LY15577 [Lamprigera yunnana]
MDNSEADSSVTFVDEERESCVSKEIVTEHRETVEPTDNINDNQTELQEKNNLNNGDTKSSESIDSTQTDDKTTEECPIDNSGSQETEEKLTEVIEETEVQENMTKTLEKSAETEETSTEAEIKCTQSKEIGEIEVPQENVTEERSVNKIETKLNGLLDAQSHNDDESIRPEINVDNVTLLNANLPFNLNNETTEEQNETNAETGSENNLNFNAMNDVENISCEVNIDEMQFDDDDDDDFNEVENSTDNQVGDDSVTNENSHMQTTVDLLYCSESLSYEVEPEEHSKQNKEANVGTSAAQDVSESAPKTNVDNSIQNVTNPIIETTPLIKSEKSDFIDNCENNSIENVSHDIHKKLDVLTSGATVNKDTSNSITKTNAQSNGKSNRLAHLPDLIVREFCLQQDSLCNLVSATIETSLTNETTEKEDQEMSLIQHLLLSEPGIASFILIEEMFKEVKNFTSTEYLLFYVKIALKCANIIPSSLKTAFDVKRRSKINENKDFGEKIQQLVRSTLNKSSTEKVDTIMKKVEGLNANELLFLHDSFPKAYKTIKEMLQKTTICCRAIVSQTIMWLKTHYVESPAILTCKPDVFKNYQNFCEKNQIKPCGIPDFGKIVKKVFPNMYHRRQVVRGKTQYFYCGLKPLFKLVTPKLPNLAAKEERENVAHYCSGCCNVYVYMHNLKYRQLSSKDYLTMSSLETPPKKRPPKDGDFYNKGNLVNKKSILVHDPLELLSLSMTDSNSSTRKPGHVSNIKQKEKPREKQPKEYNVLKTQVVREYKNTKTTATSRSNGCIRAVKFKEYRHPSIKKLLDEKVIIPYELYKTNVNPIIQLNNTELHNWCATNIKKFIQQMSNIVIVKNGDSSKLKVKYECCDKTLKVNQYYGEQLKDLKRELENLKIKRDDCNNYTVKYMYPPEKLPDLMQLTEYYNNTSIKKKLSSNKISKPTVANVEKIAKSKICSIFSAVHTKHSSIDQLFERIDNLTVPEAIVTSNVNAMVTLDSSEVIDWYRDSLNKLKYGDNIDTDDLCNETNTLTESEANVNVCEIESNDLEEIEIPNTENIECTINNLEIELPDLSKSRKRSRDESDADEPSCKKQFHLSDIINDSENQSNETTVIQNTEFEMTNLTCYFCLKLFRNETELQNHREIHLRCRTCKRRFQNDNAMLDHLIKHCFMNNAKCAPNLVLPRIDEISMVVEKYPSAFDPNYEPNTITNTVNKKVITHKITCVNKYPTSVLNFNNINHALNQNLPLVSTNENSAIKKTKIPQTYLKSQRSPSVIRFPKSPHQTEVLHYQITTNPFKNLNEVQNLQQTTSQLKSTITNNFNKIFLLPNNTSAPAPENSNVVYGLYLNNRTDRSSPICLNTFNRLGSDCALNMNPSCSNTESTNFMQIVETPNTALPPTYDATLISENNITSFEHQDHSYYQQPIYPLNNEVPPTLNNGIISGSTQQNIHANSLFEMPFLNNMHTETTHGNSIVSNGSKAESTNHLPPPIPGPFRIRVKDIRELS